MKVLELRCGFCGESTKWPEENHIQMRVYALGHIIGYCPEAPADVRAEAIAEMEAMREGVA